MTPEPVVCVLGKRGRFLVAEPLFERADRVSLGGKAGGDARPGDIVLVDRGSASASEIVAGALSQRLRAPLVGTRTFGKGVFQEIDALSNGGVLDITVANYYLPGGETISTKGIKPQIRAVDDPDTDRDEALPVAVDELLRELR